MRDYSSFILLLGKFWKCQVITGKTKKIMTSQLTSQLTRRYSMKWNLTRPARDVSGGGDLLDLELIACCGEGILR